MFDGVHLGHQQVIRQTINDARQHNGLAIAVTFDRHPKTIVAPERTPPLIYNLNQKLRAIDALGVDAILLIAFTKGFSREPADFFISQLIDGFGHVQSICVGSNFTFGYKRSGNVQVLKELGRKFGFAVHGLAAVALDGEAVSSTRIREAISTGDFDAAGQMLGRAYSLAGLVERGDQLGRKLGFPTANVNVRGLAVPPNGVYATHALVDNTTYPAATNIGFRPTIPHAEPQLRVESHIIGLDRDIYDKELELIFAERLREEQKFSSIDQLKKQIAKDIEAARVALE
jgi:riboflavin kinase/FMN adenylyltransferase